MTTADLNHESRHLQPPGAGLPFVEHLVARMMMPLWARRTSWEKAQTKIFREKDRILKMTGDLSVKTLETPILIPRLQGIEDSSRFWSLAMTMEHLIITSEGMAEIIVRLSRGESIPVVVDTAKVKPQKALAAPEAQMKFDQSMTSIAEKIATETKDRQSKAKHRHPWFGKMTTHQWHWLLGFHMAIHRKQMEAILSRS